MTEEQIAGWAMLAAVVAAAIYDLVRTEVRYRRWRRDFRAAMERARRGTWEKP